MANFLYLSKNKSVGYFDSCNIFIDDLDLSYNFKKFLLEVMSFNGVCVKDSSKFSNSDVLGHNFKFCIISDVSLASKNYINEDFYEEIKKNDDLRNLLNHYYPDISNSDYNKLEKIVCYKNAAREYECYSRDDYYSDKLFFYTDVYRVFKFLEYKNKLEYIELKEVEEEVGNNIEKIFNHIGYDYNINEEINNLITSKKMKQKL